MFEDNQNPLYTSQCEIVNKKINFINNRIDNEICYETLNKLEDSNLMDEYIKCKSVINAIHKLKVILEKHKIKEKELIIDDYLLELIPAGTKGVVRGNKFNKIVENLIKNIKLDEKCFEVCFEKKCELYLTDEIPDWYILEKSTNKIILGMNQLDLFNGGHQINRGYKYLIDNKHNTKNSKFLCVICNKIKFLSDANKAFKLFEIGFSNDTLCYVKNIENIIQNYFN